MVTEQVEAPAPTTDPEPQVEPQTETPPAEPEERAAAEPEAAAVQQVSVTEPEYVTREELERERQNAAAAALEADRRRRQTENARKAALEKKAQEDQAELIDTVKAAFGARGIYEVPDDVVVGAVDRVAKKRLDQLSEGLLTRVDEAWDYITAPAYGKDVALSLDAEATVKLLFPKVQGLIDAIRPQLETEARKGYIAESDLPKRVEAEIARRNAQKRQGEEDVAHVEGSPAPTKSDNELLADPHTPIEKVIEIRRRQRGG